MLVCPACKIEYSKGQKYCGQCGSTLIKLLLDIDEGKLKKEEDAEEGGEVLLVCSSCGASHKKVMNYCTYCGVKLVEGEVEIKGKQEEKSKVAEEIKSKTIEVKVICPFCHVENPAGREICINCGIDLIEEPKKEEEVVKSKEARKEADVIRGEEVAKAKRELKIEASKVSDDTAVLEKEALVKCPNCNFEQLIGDGYCDNCGSPLSAVIETHEISKEDLKSEAEVKKPKPMMKEPEVAKVPSPPRQVVEAKTREKSKLEPSAAPVQPAKPKSAVPKVPQVAQKAAIEKDEEKIALEKKIPKIRTAGLTEKLTSVIFSKVFIIGIGALIIAVLAVVMIPKFVEKKESKKMEVVTVPLFIEGIDIGNMPVVMKGYGEYYLRTNIPVKIYIDEKFYGYSPLNGIVLVSGFHDIRLVNEEYLVNEKRQIYIDVGKPLEEELTLGRFGTVNINAIPWAEVYIDEKYVGQTPIANLRLPVGTHEVKFINPKFPIKRRNIEIIEGSNTNISVELKYSNY